MAKKYLSLEEVSGMLGISEEALKKARENGDVRGFADRGNWKFREEDVEEFGRTLSTDSSPEVPLFGDEQGSVLGDDDDPGEQPTEIRKGSGDSNVLSDDNDILVTDADEGASDSGVRMMLDDNLLEGDSSEEAPPLLADSDPSSIPLQMSDSDGEMGLEEESSADIPLQLGDDSDNDFALGGDDGSDDLPLSLDDSDSDVKLTNDPNDDSLADSSEEVLLTGQDSDSDVRLLGQTMPMMVDSASDSDVRLIKTDSDSDVQLVGSDSDSDVRLLSPDISKEPGSDSDVKLSGAGDTEIAITLGSEGLYEEEDDESVLSLDSDSDVALAEDSGIALDSATDSGIALDVGDSGIALDVGDSDIALDVGDSDIALDEGLTLDTTGDSGISLDTPTDSGISLDGDMDKTALVLQLDDNMSADSETMVAIPSLDDDDSESDFELGALEGDSSSDTSVHLFDDEDDDDDRAATMIKKATDDHEETFDLDAGDAFDEEFEDEDDLLGEDDEVEDFADDDSFMADDDAFDDDSFVDSESAATGPVQLVAAAEQEWGGIMFAMTLISSIAMLFCCGVLFDLIRYTSKSGEYGVVAGWFIETVGK
jgi:hypothetical protein